MFCHCLDYRGAIAHYTLAIETSKSDKSVMECTPTTLASYYSNRAAAFSMLLQYENAIDDCNEAINVDNRFIKAHFRKARTLTICGKLKEAIDAFRKGLIHDPNNGAAIKEKENVETIQRRYDLTLSILQKEPLSKRDATQVLRQMELILKTCSSWKDAIFCKAKALFYLQNTQEAYALTTTLVRMGGIDTNELVQLRANILFEMGNIDDSIKHLRQILNGDPDNKKAFTMLKFLKSLGKKKSEADTAYTSKQYEKAIEFYTEAIQMFQLNVNVNQTKISSTTYIAKLHFNRASSHANLRHHEQVIQDCSYAIQLDDKYLKAYIRRAASHLIIGDESNCMKAIQDYQFALQNIPSADENDLKKKINAAQIQLKRSKRKDFYKILGVPKDATDSEIKKCYRKLALKYHPDRHANSTEEKKKEAESIFRDVNLAYEVLSDPTKKQRYDSGVEEQDLDNPHAKAGGPHGPHGGIDPNDLFAMFMQQQSMRGGRGRGGTTFHFG